MQCIEGLREPYNHRRGDALQGAGSKSEASCRGLKSVLILTLFCLLLLPFVRCSVVVSAEHSASPYNARIPQIEQDVHECEQDRKVDVALGLSVVRRFVVRSSISK